MCVPSKHRSKADHQSHFVLLRFLPFLLRPLLPAYARPNLVAVLTLASFVYFANVARWIADELLFAGLLGEILVGIIFGAPLAGILSASWEQTFLDLGYIGLLLVVFEGMCSCPSEAPTGAELTGPAFPISFAGGLTTPLQKLVKALPLASAIALSGIGIPIALSFLLIHIGSYSRLEAFAAGSSLSSTSLGTTFVVLKAVSGGDVPVGRLEETLLGTVLGTLRSCLVFRLSKLKGRLSFL